MRQKPITVLVILLAVGVIPSLIFNSGYAQLNSTNSCPSGQVPVVKGGKAVIDNQTHSIKCIPIDASAALLGQ